ncbi:MAG: FAD-binding domain-containing protein, partial [Pseudomonadales bacterium]|nr:FAD-binding domain-containing protein [Pseudomonadales bacterium]
MQPVHVVWFKRDLRIEDHAPLAAAARGRVLPLYLVEPGLWQLDDADGLHWRRLRGALVELRATLAERGAPLVVRTGDAVEVLEALWQQTRFPALHSHQETGNGWTFARDRAVQHWCRSRGVHWEESLQFGVFRGTPDREGWSRRWEHLMARPRTPAVAALQATGVDPGPIPEWPTPQLRDLHPAVERRVTTADCGATAAHAGLEAFLGGRGRRYHLEMSSPLTAFEACSRLSAPLSIGSLSLRHVVQRTRAVQRALKNGTGQLDDGTPFPRRALSAFASRLHWHCHFMQKLESEPELEWRCFNRALDDLRERPGSEPLLLAWQQGRTGLPFVDACMRALQHHGWINFRMRAMLVAVAAYHLWLDWRDFGPFLARQFVDYEPGIHISQLQMQSGVTGINTLRIYNPVKQGHDQDPEGDFVRRWVPELAAIPGPAIHEPWTLSPGDLDGVGIVLGRSYPLPVVDHLAAARDARRRLGQALASPAARSESARVLREHG